MNADRVTAPAAGGRRFKAFLSYSSADVAAATTVQAALHSFNRSWYALWSFRVFRDATDVQIGTDLRKIISDALDDSDWFILLLSRNSMKSPWVAREVEYWLKHRGLETILVIVDETLTWDDAASEFRMDEPAGHSELTGLFDVEPSYVDLRWIATSPNPRDDARLLDPIAELTEKITGREKAILIGEDRRKQRWRLLLAGAAIVTLLVLAVAASIFAVGQRMAVLEGEADQRFAEVSAGKAEAETRRATKEQRKTAIALTNEQIARTTAEKRRIEAERQTRLATGNRLATLASMVVRTDPAVSVLLATEAAHRSGWMEGDRLPSIEQTLQNALRATGGKPLPKIDQRNGIVSDHHHRFATLLGEKGVVRLYDLSQPDPLSRARQLGKLRYKANTIAMSGDGGTIYAFSRANVRDERPERVIWKVTENGTASRIELPPIQDAWSAGLSEDGRWAFTGTFDGFVQIEDLLERSRPPLRWQTGSDHVSSVHAAMPWIVTSASNGEVRCRNTQNLGDSAADDLLATAEDDSVAFATNERHFAIGHNGIVAVYELTADGCRQSAELRQPAVRTSKVLAIDDTGSLVATAGRNDVLDLTNVATGKLASFMCPRASWSEFSPDGRYLASASVHDRECAVRVWNLADMDPGASVVLLPNDGNEWLQQPPRFSGDGRWLITNASGKARLWNRVNGYFSSSAEVLASDKEEGNYAVAAPNAPRFGVVHGDQYVETYDLDAPSITPLSRFSLLPNDRLRAVSNDLQHWLSTSEFSDSLLDRYGNRVATIAGGQRKRIANASFNLTGTLLVITRDDGTAVIVDVRNPRLITEVPKTNIGVGRMPAVFSDDGRWLFAGQWLAHLDRRPVKFIRLEPIREEKADEEFRAAAFTHDGRMLITGCGQWTQFWDLTAAVPRPTNVHANTDDVRTIAVNADDRHVVTGSYDKSVHVFDLTNVTSPRLLRAARNMVLSCAISADGHWLATGSNDAHVWDANAEPKTSEPVSFGLSGFITSIQLSRDGERLMAACALDGPHERVVVFYRSLPELERIATQTLRSNLSPSEWQQYFPTEPYRKTFPQLASE